MSKPNSIFANSQIFSVLNLPVHLLDDYVGWLYQRLTTKQGTHVVTLNAEMAILTQTDATLAQIIQEADLVIPDGAGVIIYMRMRGIKHRRCPGIELAESLLYRVGNAPEIHSVCFFGGSPGVSEGSASLWREKFPNLRISTQHGYLSEEEQQQWRENLQQEQPQIIFVGLGVPRQEIWIQKYRYLCPSSIWIGVGGSFDIWSGEKNRAPSWLRNNNLEWSYRLYQEPYRWRRMLALPKFFLLSLRKQ
ncbi:Glycosyl transferase, WecB/TagA/CpsF family [Hyella patelloides LEGE 07179]|uniref:Glycosyl transferase, WecB/TagA/CpsF family n=1 Tax=Hyella patelloides LEGE 07179 TaxID=945734 RepID=A0A563VTF4_9CYAN|nr:WecB/TagA/CpsF family glycosyltransferase [Hyella patelloides]VEP14664.1 Glycosyl transferase, WecB/TagA/CpsF family [Hyella patelloides LEGE 07179]